MLNDGDAVRFKSIWKRKDGKNSNWFCKGKPQNQIQFAFQQHFSFLREVIKIPQNGHCLEVGCGKGSLSSFFAEAGYEVTLLDISADVIDRARAIFRGNRHLNKAHFKVGDANNLPFEDNSFDVITSIGLLEHFEDPEKTISEQVRVLKMGGVFTAYVVPQKWSVQDVFNPLNALLKTMAPFFGGKIKRDKKDPLFRTNYDLDYYKKILDKCGLKSVKGSGVYPFPAVSYSTDFPFSIMPSQFEKVLVKIFGNIAAWRRKQGEHSWSCEEAWGQAFFVWGTKR